MKLYENIIKVFLGISLFMTFKYLLAVFSAFLLLNFCFAANISGAIYDAMSLEPLKNAVIDVNSTPSQQIVSKDGNYSVQLPVGDYSIRAFYFQGNLKLVADENISIESEGNFVLDLILFPEINGTGDTNIPIGTQLPPSENPPVSGIDFFQIILTAIFFAAIIFLGIKFFPALKEKYAHFVGQEKAPQLPAKEQISAPAILVNSNLPAPEENLDKYALEVLDVLKRSGNRLTQKELREKVSSVGEAKISLIVSELEQMGKVKKIKKGRGNIIILKV